MMTTPTDTDATGDLERNPLYRLWENRRAGRRYPARRDFDVRDFAPWLGDLELVDVVREDRVRYRFRLVGTNITAIDGTDATGQFADEIFTDNLAHVISEYEEVLRTGAPCLRPRLFRLSRRGYQTSYHKLVLPLADDGETIDMLLVQLREIRPAA